MEIRNSRCVVIGGAGFLGSHLVDHLIDDRACDVLVLDKEVTVATGRAKEWFDGHSTALCDEIKELVARLQDPDENYRIGMAGYERCRELLEWTDEKKQRLADFLTTHGLPASI